MQYENSTEWVNFVTELDTTEFCDPLFVTKILSSETQLSISNEICLNKCRYLRCSLSLWLKSHWTLLPDWWANQSEKKEHKVCTEYAHYLCKNRMCTKTMSQYEKCVCVSMLWFSKSLTTKTNELYLPIYNCCKLKWQKQTNKQIFIKLVRYSSKTEYDMNVRAI